MHVTFSIKKRTTTIRLSLSLLLSATCVPPYGQDPTDSKRTSFLHFQHLPPFSKKKPVRREEKKERDYTKKVYTRCITRPPATHGREYKNEKRGSVFYFFFSSLSFSPLLVETFLLIFCYLLKRKSFLNVNFLFSRFGELIAARTTHSIER